MTIANIIKPITTVTTKAGRVRGIIPFLFRKEISTSSKILNR